MTAAALSQPSRFPPRAGSGLSMAPREPDSHNGLYCAAPGTEEDHALSRTAVTAMSGAITRRAGEPREALTAQYVAARRENEAERVPCREALRWPTGCTLFLVPQKVYPAPFPVPAGPVVLAALCHASRTAASSTKESP
jgi:hypothetical protein